MFSDYIDLCLTVSFTTNIFVFLFLGYIGLRITSKDLLFLITYYIRVLPARLSTESFFRSVMLSAGTLISLLCDKWSSHSARSRP